MNLLLLFLLYSWALVLNISTGINATILSKQDLPKESAFSFSDNADVYEETDVHEVFGDDAIYFKPPRLVYDNAPICIPAISQFELHNVLNHSVDILAVTSHDPQFHPVLFTPQIIGPESSLIIQILFLPYFLDSSSSELVIETSEGNLYYQVEGRATENPYRLRPFIDQKVIIGSRFNPLPVYMFNPHETTLHIMEVFTTEDFISLTDSHSQHLKPNAPSFRSGTGSGSKANNSLDILWTIPSNAEEIVMTFHISSTATTTPGIQRGYVHIKTDHDKMIVPVQIEFVAGGVRLMDPVGLNFGVLSNTNEQKNLDLLVVNDGDTNVKILDIAIEGAGDGLTAVFDDELMIYTGRPYNKLASTIFRSTNLRVGLHVGKIVITTNSSGPSDIAAGEPGAGTVTVLEVPFSAIVVHGGIGFEVENVTYYMHRGNIEKRLAQFQQEHKLAALDLSDESLCIPHTQEALFQNHFSSPITVFDARLQSCQDLVRLSRIPNEAELQPLQSWGAIEMTFCVEKVYSKHLLAMSIEGTLAVPKTCWMEIISNVSIHRVPIYLSDGRLEVELVDAAATSVADGAADDFSSAREGTGSVPVSYRAIPSDSNGTDGGDTFLVDLGLLSKQQPRDLRLILSNRNSISNFVGLEATSHDLCICFESSWPIEYFADQPELMESYMCSWPSRTYEYALAHEKARCSCHRKTVQSPAASPQSPPPRSAEPFVALQAKVRPGYSALLSILFHNMTDLPTSQPGWYEGKRVDIYSMNFTLRSRMQSIAFHIQFMLISQQVHTFADRLEGNRGHFVLGSLTPSVYWSTAAFPNQWHSFLLTSDSPLMDVHFSGTPPFEGQPLPHNSTAVQLMDSAYRKHEEALYGPIVRQVWKAEIMLDFVSKAAIMKCIADRLQLNPMGDGTPSVWSLLVGVFCAMPGNDAFSGQWIEAVRRLEASKSFPLDLNLLDMRSLTMQLRTSWLQLHGMEPLKLPPVNILIKSASLLHLHNVNTSVLEIPVVTMPSQYAVRLAHSPVGQPISIYLDLVNPHDVDSKVSFFRLVDPAFTFQFQSKVYCEEAVDTTDDDVELLYVYDQAVWEKILERDVQESLRRNHSTNASTGRCSLKEGVEVCAAEPSLSFVPFACEHGMCTVPAAAYTAAPTAKPVLVTSAHKRVWAYQPSTVHECFSPVRSQAALNMTIPKRSHARVGPIIFNPDAVSAKDYKGTFIIYNSFSGYEQFELLIRTEKPQMDVHGIHFCETGDLAQVACTAYTNHTSLLTPSPVPTPAVMPGVAVAPVGGAVTGSAAINAPTRAHTTPGVRVTQSLVMHSHSERALLYVTNRSNITVTVWDIEVDGVRCTADKSKASSTLAPMRRSAQRPECRLLPLKLQSQEKIPIELAGMLSCAFSSQFTHLRLYDHHGKEPLLSLDLTLTASDAFVSGCLNQNQTLAGKVLITCILWVLLGGSCVFILVSLRIVMRLCFVSLAPQGEVDRVLSPSRLQSSRIGAILAHSRFLISGLSRSRTASEDGGGSIMDLSDVKSVHIAPVRPVCRAVAHLQQTRAVAAAAVAAAAEEQAAAAAAAAAAAVAAAAAAAVAAAVVPVVLAIPVPAATLASPVGSVTQPHPSSPAGGAEMMATSMEQTSSKRRYEANSMSITSLVAGSGEEHITGAKEQPKERVVASDLTRVTVDTICPDDDYVAVRSDGTVQTPEPIPSPSASDRDCLGIAPSASDKLASLASEEASGTPSIDAGFATPTATVSPSGNLASDNDDDFVETSVRKAIEALSAERDKTDVAEDEVIAEPPPLALVSDYVATNSPLVSAMTFNAFQPNEGGLPPAPGLPPSSRGGLSLDLSALSDHGMPPIEPSPSHVQWSLQPSPVKEAGWEAKMAFPGAPPGLAPVVSLPPLSRGQSDSADSPVFMYRGELLDHDGIFSPGTTASSARSVGVSDALFTSQQHHALPAGGASAGIGTHAHVRANPMALPFQTSFVSSAHDVLVSSDERGYLQNLMTSTRAGTSHISRSWDQILSDPEPILQMSPPQGSRGAFRRDPYRAGSDGFGLQLPRQSPEGGLYAVASERFAPMASQSQPSSTIGAAAAKPAPYIPPHMRARGGQWPPGPSTSGPPPGSRMNPRESSWSALGLGAQSPVDNIIDNDGDLPPMESSTWRSMNEAPTRLRSVHQHSTGSGRSTQRSRAQAARGTMQPQSQPPSRPQQERPAQQRPPQDVPAFFGPGGFFDDGQQDSTFGTLEDGSSSPM